MSTLLVAIYTILGVCISLKFMDRTFKYKYDIDVPMLCIVGAILIYAWPIYLVYYFYTVEE